MNKTIIRKAAAFACSITVLSALGISASAQISAPADTDVNIVTDVNDSAVNVIAGNIEAAPGETVSFPVYIANNTAEGFAATGLRLNYDSRLTPCTNEDGSLVADENCVAGDALNMVFGLNADQNCIGIGTMGSQAETDNGLFCTIDFTIPADAQEGDVYAMDLEVSTFTDAKLNAIVCEAIGGSITVTEGSVPIDGPIDPVDEAVKVTALNVTAVPGETVSFLIFIANNNDNGFAVSGIRLNYDPRLTPRTNEDGSLVVDESGAAGDSLTKFFSLNADENCIGIGTMGIENETDDGMFCTIDFKVPEDAQEGDVYTMDLEVTRFGDAQNHAVAVEAIDGSITVEEGTVPIDGPVDPVNDPVSVIAGSVEAAPGEIVSFPVYIDNNTATGFAASGIRLITIPV